MFYTLVSIHSFVRWLVLAGLLYSMYRAYKGFTQNLLFNRIDNTTRHWTATMAHIQLVIGIVIYTQSPVTNYFWKHFDQAILQIDAAFFGLIHIAFMFSAVVMITIGSALSKTQETDRQKFKTMLIWYSLSLIVIFMAIPWPFSPLANRPYIR